jgi:hypothetical protein
MTVWDGAQAVNLVAFGIHLHNWLNGRAPLWSFTFTIVGGFLVYLQQRRVANQQAAQSTPDEDVEE